MTSFWIGYVVVALLLAIIKAAIDDHCRDRVLAHALWVAAIIVVFTIFLLTH